MKNRSNILIIILCITLLLSSCGIASSNNNKIIQYFEKDIYTQKVDTLKASETDMTTSEENYNTDKNNSHTDADGYDSTLAEITLVGNDSSIAYDIIDNTDIKYRGILYKNLYTNINSLSTDYDKNTLINFIIKTYKAKSSLIYTVVYTDEAESEDSDIEAITLDDMLSDCDQYEITKNKYNETVSWMLQLIDSETRQEVQMYGATSYILVTSDGISKEIDMTEYDSGVNKNNRANSDETIENETESTEISEETVE